ncbi:MAG TPA: hypothetical protein VM684_06775, partial [Gaiellales bacterium]|nr:hypothetical protein [Gaiellales bacterium]
MGFRIRTAGDGDGGWFLPAVVFVLAVVIPIAVVLPFTVFSDNGNSSSSGGGGSSGGIQTAPAFTTAQLAAMPTTDWITNGGST